MKIHTDAEGKKIVRVEDRWNDELPEGAFAKVSFVVWVVVGEIC